MEWPQLIANFGVAVAGLIAFAAAAYRLGVWLGDKIALPLVNRHLAFLDSLQRNIDSMTASLTLIQQETRQLTAQLQTSSDLQAQMVQQVAHLLALQSQPPGPRV